MTPSTIRHFEIWILFQYLKLNKENRFIKYDDITWLNIVLTQIRCFACFLNYDLFHLNIVTDPPYHCDTNRELQSYILWFF